MTELSRIWNSIPDAYQVLDPEGRLTVEAFWSGMEQLVVQLIADLGRVDNDPNIELAQPNRVVKWCRFDFSNRITELAIDDDILSIPVLQDSISDPQRQWMSGREYALMDGKIVWDTVYARPDGIAWAPFVYMQNRRIHDTLGDAVAVDLADIGWDTPTALKTIRALWYCYQHGPTMENMRFALNAMLALPHMQFAGKVTFIGDGEIAVRYGDTCHGVSDYEGTVVCGDPILAAETGVEGGTVAGADRITVDSLSGFPSSGTLVMTINGTSSVVAYTGKDVDDSSFTGCTDVPASSASDDTTVSSYKATGSAFLSRRALQSDNLLGCVDGDWLVPDVNSQSPARQIVSCATEFMEDPIIDDGSEGGPQTNGTTSSDGHFFAGGGDWSNVNDGDILEVSAPSSIAGQHLIASSMEDGAFLREPLPANLTGVSYRVLRRPWVELDGEIEPEEELAFSIVRPSFAWRENMWIGSTLTDGGGGVHTITGNRDSILFCPEAAAPGAMSIDPLYYDQTNPTETFRTLNQAAVLPEVGDYLRRFEPLLDGVRLNDWRTDRRWNRWHPPVLSLTGDDYPDGTSTVEVASTAGIVVGTMYTLMAVGQDSLEVTVMSVDSANNELVLDRDISAEYSLDNMALMVPARRPVEGLLGFLSSRRRRRQQIRTLTDWN